MFETSGFASDYEASGLAAAALPAAHLRGLDRPERAAERDGYISGVYLAHERALRSFLSRFLRNADDIADTVQEVFVRIAQLPDPSKVDLNPRAYLFRVAQHLVVDRIRRDRYRQTDRHVPLDGIDIESHAPAIDEQVNGRRVLIDIARRLDAAGPRVTQVVEMSCLHDLTHTEIAGQLGVTTRTVERCMQRARVACMPLHTTA